MTKLENALVWLYIKTWGKFGEHVIKEKDLWQFGDGDLETVIMGLAFPRKKEKSELVEALTGRIMEKFEQDGIAFYEWAAKIHSEVIETLQQTVQLNTVKKATTSRQPRPSVVRIFEWEPGKYSRL